MKTTNVILVVLTLFFVNRTNAQFEPDTSNNYFLEKELWTDYFDSVQAYNFSVGDSSMKGTGLKEFRNWKSYWENIIPGNGSFAEGEMQFQEMVNFQKNQHHKHNVQVQSNTAAIAPVSWTEIGPMDMSKILTRSGSTWVQAHSSGQNNLSSAMHVSKVDRLYQHPLNDNTIFAIGGEVDNSGGGLFVSYDSGLNWQVMGTDLIPKLNISSFAIKPSGVSPDPSNEILFIGLTSGAMYRSINNGVTWLECNYNGTSQYPYVWDPSSPSPNSLPNVNFYFSQYNGKVVKSTEATFTKANASSTSDYSRLILCRKDGLYYSDNYFAPISIGNNTINNQIVWNEFNMSSIESQILPFDASTTSREFHYMEFEQYETGSSGNIVYLVYVQVLEKDIDGNNLGNTRHYVLQSFSYGASWGFLGGSYNSSPQSDEIFHEGFISAHIEVRKMSPNFIYLASPKIIGANGPILNPSSGQIDATRSMHLHQYVISTSSWNDLSAGDNGFNNNGMIAQGNGFALDPVNDNNWWFYTNASHRKRNGVLLTDLGYPLQGYSKTYHADLRDILVLRNGDLLAGTDGGVYHSTDNGLTFVSSSEGMGMSHPSSMALSQKPPFYVASGFWHSGFQIYNPDEDKWHWRSTGDGQDGEIFFLNNEVYNVAQQTSIYLIFKNYNQLVPGGALRIKTASSENIQGRAYGSKNIAVGGTVVDADLVYSNNDFSANQVMPGAFQYLPSRFHPIVVPNQPDRLIVSYNTTDANGYVVEKLDFISGMASTTPNPTLDETINLSQTLFDPTLQKQSHFKSIVYDPRRNGKYWILLNNYDDWSNYKRRILEYDPDINDYVDITFKTEDAIYNNGLTNRFPGFIHINNLVMDRQTGILYIGTTNGVYYLDRGNETWKKYSTNVPSSTSDIGIIHCTGEIYAAIGTRGIWKAPLIRDVARLEWNIDQNETWADRTNLFCTLIIKSGTTLTLTGEIVVYGDQKIIVEPGARLDISNGKITTECGDYWQGIELLGNNNLHQNSINQGRVTITNGTIENAREAIMPWKYGDWSKTGGIIQATRATFRNNKRSIQYMAYQNINPNNGAEQNNLGFFSDCTFEWTDDFFEERPRPAITMNGVKGVNISGCTFQDLRTNITDVHDRGRGIFTIDAGYSVKGRSLLLNPPTHHYYDETNYDVSEFINLYKGVEDLSGSAAYPFLVDHCKFLNCQEGITVNAVDNALLTRNFFNHDGNCPLDIQYAYNLNLVSSTAYNVQGNIFENDLGIPNLGVHALNTSIAENEIRKNKFFNQRTANGAVGRNGNDFVNNSAKGLQFLCNENTGNMNDMFVTAWTNSNDQGVRLFQGAPGKATLNELSQNLQLGGHHFSSNDQQNLIYYWFGSSNQPTVINGNITPTQLFTTTECPSIFEGIVMVAENEILTAEPQDNLETELITVKTDFTALNDAFSSHLSDGNASTLYDLVDNLTLSNRVSVKQALLDESPYLSTALLTELGNKATTLFPHEWLQELIEANIEVFWDYSFRDFLSTKSEPLPTLILDDLTLYSQNNQTQRGLDMAEIGQYTSRMAQIENLLIANLAFSEELEDQTALPSSIENRANYVKRAELIDYYIGIGDISEANAQISILQQELPNMNYSDLNEELIDFIKLKEYIILNLNASNTLDAELTAADKVFFINARDNYTGRAAYQAGNILCFYADICVENDPMNLAAIGRSQGENGQANESITVLEDKGNFVLYPNPNDGTFVIKGINNIEIKRIEIQDIQGKSMTFGTTEINDETVQIDFKSAKRGLYIVQIWNVNGEVQNIRILKN